MNSNHFHIRGLNLKSLKILEINFHAETVGVINLMFTRDQRTLIVKTQLYPGNVKIRDDS